MSGLKIKDHFKAKSDLEYVYKKIKFLLQYTEKKRFDI